MARRHIPGRPDIPEPEERLRAQTALQHRISGMTYQEIADTMGIKHRGTVVNMVGRLLDRRENTAVAELRKVEDERLDAWQKRLVDELNAIPVGLGPEVAGKLISTLLRVSERRAKLHGLDKPVQVEISTVDPTILTQVEELKAGLDRFINERRSLPAGVVDADTVEEGAV